MQNRSKDSGFSLMEVMIALLLLTVGLVGLSALYAQAVGTMHLSQERMIAKQKCREILESIYTARNTQQITFDMVQNVGAGGIFLDGWQPMQEPNPSGGGGDGLVGTADDGDIEQIVLPGHDGLMGTADDEVRSLAQMQREILIQPVLLPSGTPNPDLRQITVTVQYAAAVGARPASYSVGSLISRFR
jgi:prepilin-type N-terminal cleavage/methylation domain-containing protein